MNAEPASDRFGATVCPRRRTAYRQRWRQARHMRRRTGVAALDYALVLGVVIPMAALLMWVGPRIMRLVYEMISVVVSWPFM